MNALVIENDIAFPKCHAFQSRDGVPILFEVYGAWVLTYFKEERHILHIEEFQYLYRSMLSVGFNVGDLMNFLYAPSVFRKEVIQEQEEN